MTTNKTLLASDLHLTDNPLDEYRWGLFQWLKQQCKAHRVTEIFLLGDITDQKDRHSSLLVNRVVDEIGSLASIAPVTILRGNHDGIDPNTPYFRFLSHMKDVQFIYKPTRILRNVFLPHSKDLAADWKATMRETDFIPNKEMKRENAQTTVFLHATVGGCLVENGAKLDGVPLSLFKDFHGSIYAGDIHVPQTIGPVTYVGSPYPVHFGDKFPARCLLLDDNKTTDLHYPCLRRLKLFLATGKDAAKVDIRKGDQVKVVVQLNRSEALDWEKHRELVKQAVTDAEAELCGLEIEVTGIQKELVTDKKEVLPDLDLLDQFGKREGLSKDLLDIGQVLLEESSM